MDKNTCVKQYNKVHLSDCLKYAMLVNLRHIPTLYIVQYFITFNDFVRKTNVYYIIRLFLMAYFIPMVWCKTIVTTLLNFYITSHRHEYVIKRIHI